MDVLQCLARKEVLQKSYSRLVHLWLHFIVPLTVLILRFRTLHRRYELLTLRANLRMNLYLKSNNCSEKHTNSIRIPLNGREGSNPQLYDDTRKLTNSLTRCRGN